MKKEFIEVEVLEKSEGGAVLIKIGTWEQWITDSDFERAKREDLRAVPVKALETLLEDYYDVAEGFIRDEEVSLPEEEVEQAIRELTERYENTNR